MIDRYTRLVSEFVICYERRLRHEIEKGQRLADVAEALALVVGEEVTPDFTLSMFGHAIAYMREGWAELGAWFDASCYALPSGVEVPVLLKDWPAESKRPEVQAALARAAALYRRRMPS